MVQQVLKAGGLIVLLAALASAPSAEPNRVTFPDNLDVLRHYTTVTRGNITEYMYASDEALAAIRAGEELAVGTQIILEDRREGEVYRLFVMEKGEGWGEDYDPSRRAGDWQFQYFWPDGSINEEWSSERCRSCHMSRADESYMYTYTDARNFE